MVHRDVEKTLQLRCVQIDDQADQSDKLQSAERSAYQNAIINLRNALVLYQRLKNSLQPEGVENFTREIEEFVASAQAGARAAGEKEKGQPFDKAKLDQIATAIQRYDAIASSAYILPIPPRERLRAPPPDVRR